LPWPGVQAHGHFAGARRPDGLPMGLCPSGGRFAACHPDGAGEFLPHAPLGTEGARATQRCMQEEADRPLDALLQFLGR
jgi:hypothetical protein